MAHIQHKEVCLCRTGRAESAQIPHVRVGVGLVFVLRERDVIFFFYKTPGRQTVNRKVVITLSREKKQHFPSRRVSLNKLGGRRAKQTSDEMVAHVYESLIHAGGSNTETESIILRLKWTWNYCHTIWPGRPENQSSVGNG